MKTNTMFGLVLCLGLQVSVALRAQTSQSVMAAGDAGRTMSTESGGAEGARSPALTGERHPLYRLRTNDVMEISFTFAPEFNQTVTVQPDGFIALKGLEKQMYAQGMTLPELQEGIRPAYAGMLHDPEIAIVLKEFDRPVFHCRWRGG